MIRFFILPLMLAGLMLVGGLGRADDDQDLKKEGEAPPRLKKKKRADAPEAKKDKDKEKIAKARGYYDKVAREMVNQRLGQRQALKAQAQAMAEQRKAIERDAQRMHKEADRFREEAERIRQEMERLRDDLRRQLENPHADGGESAAVATDAALEGLKKKRLREDPTKEETDTNSEPSARGRKKQKMDKIDEFKELFINGNRIMMDHWAEERDIRKEEVQLRREELELQKQKLKLEAGERTAMTNVMMALAEKLSNK